MQTYQEYRDNQLEQYMLSNGIQDNVVDKSYARYAIACYRTSAKLVITRLAFSININIFKGI